MISTVHQRWYGTTGRDPLDDSADQICLVNVDHSLPRFLAMPT